MNSEDWKTVLLSLIAAVVTISAAYSAILMDTLRKRQIEAKKDVNGRLDQLIASRVSEALAQGKLHATAVVAQAIVDSPNIPIGAKDMANAISKIDPSIH